MSAALAVREPGPPASVQRPIEDRGTTTLYDRVVEKVAARAALEVRHCLPLRHSIVGIAVSGRDANAAATTDGSITALSLTVAIAYPAPLQTVTGRSVSTSGPRSTGCAGCRWTTSTSPSTRSAGRPNR